MQKEIKLLIDSFLEWYNIQPLLINEDILIETVNYLNKSYVSNIEELRENIVPNIMLFETEEKTFKIEKTREIIEKSSIKPWEKFNIFIIREIDKLSIAASNSLLKILEDVPDNIIFLLTTNAKENLLETIYSRILDFGSNSIKFEINEETKNIIDEFFAWNKVKIVNYIFWEKILRHEYIAILEYFLVKLRKSSKWNQQIIEKILTWISDIYSTNANPKYILDWVILDIE